MLRRHDHDAPQPTPALSASPMATCDTAAVVTWLTDGARSAAGPQDVLGELCERLVACGIPLWRVAVLVRTLHPNITGRRFLWRADSGVAISELHFEGLQTAEFLSSPVASVYSSGTALRRRFVDDSATDEFALLRDLRAEGVSDYLASPLFFSDGAVHVASWATRRQGGFTAEQLAGIEAVVAPLARVAEIRALSRNASNLLNTYVGRHTGERILAGQIRRGDTESIHAAIWLSDMRGFTALSDRLPPPTLIALLNRYFDCQVPPIHDHGGEVLKFMGDGLLAIFPVEQKLGNADAVCNAALLAAHEARQCVTELSSSAETEGVHGLRFGLALHVGEVLYGNIGGGNRLDFTCIGPAVNLAARLEKLAGTLGHTVLASSAFAHHCLPHLLPAGEFALAGFQAKQMVYALVDEINRPDAKSS